jgi:ribosome hibernation promoting factor
MILQEVGMKITYTGRQMELSPAQFKKIEEKFGKLKKLLDGKGEREAHVVLAQERHLNKIEITVPYHDHPLVVVASDTDLFTAIHSAIEKLEKQAIKVKAKWREAKRTPRKEVAAVAVTVEAEGERAEPARRVYRVNHHERRKPMTLEEALMEMEKDRDYLVFRDVETDRLNMLMRRRDGHFDLVEA